MALPRVPIVLLATSVQLVLSQQRRLRACAPQAITAHQVLSLNKPALQGPMASLVAAHHNQHLVSAAPKGITVPIRQLQTPPFAQLATTAQPDCQVLRQTHALRENTIH